MAEEQKVNLVQRMFLDIFRDTGYAPDPKLIEKIANGNTMRDLNYTKKMLTEAKGVFYQSVMYDPDSGRIVGYKFSNVPLSVRNIFQTLSRVF